ncbi:MAG: hypothetical protein DLM70_14430 [Chloroflexi bacterium]|nr:MAG: hypothetical protein DLM70_14430 [Chloroflexota bacterium]
MSTLLRQLKPYSYQIFLLLLIPVAFWLDVHTKTLLLQHLLGLAAWVVLFVATRFSPPSERRQIWVMVGVATCVEIWGSLIWGIYRYRLGNVPMFVPPGHGLVYLFALRSARTPVMLRHKTLIKNGALAGATAWALFGLTLEPLLFHRLDVTGALFWPIFLWFMRKPSASVYAAAFLVTSFLELWGTSLGNWAWQVSAPVTQIPTGNPPSVIAAGYCVMDFIALQIAAMLPPAGILTRVLAHTRLRPAPVEARPVSEEALA